MNIDWHELVSLLDEAGLILVRGIPTADHADLLPWPADDVAGWIDTASRAGVKLVYAEEVLLSERVASLREELEDARTADEQFDAEAISLELQLSEIAARFPDQVIGWMGEWRFDGVLHGVEAAELPDALQVIADRLREHTAQAPSRLEIRRLDALDWHERREAEQRQLQERFEAAVSALADHPDFPSCRNMGLRKSLLMRLGLDLVGLNKEEIVQLARQKLEERGSTA